VLTIVERLMRERDTPEDTTSGELTPDIARALTGAWLHAVDPVMSETTLIRRLQEGELSHHDLHRRACRIHERRLASVAREIVQSSRQPSGVMSPSWAGELFDACLPVIPYTAAAAFLGREKARLARPDGDRPRIALVTEGLEGTHGVSHTIRQIRERGIPGFDVEVVGTDPGVDRRLAAVAEVEVPFYPGLHIGIPSLSVVVEALAERNYDLIHLATPGPTGVAAWLLARMLGTPLVGSYHTELAAYAALRSGDPQLEALVRPMLGAFYGSCDAVLSPSPATDAGLRAIGVPAGRIRRWVRGVDLDRFDPALREPGLLPGELTVLYAGRLSKEKGIELMIYAFLAARRQDPRLHLVVAGGGPEEAMVRDRLGSHASLLGWLEGTALARVYASADIFLFASQTDTYGQVIVEAQASGLPVVAVAEGGPRSLIEPGETGLLAAARADALAGELLRLARDPLLRERIRRNARAAVATRTWEAALEQLAESYSAALGRGARGAVRRVA
jgi:glycosyltransferase involved in cell wall biosynthesis